MANFDELSFWAKQKRTRVLTNDDYAAAGIDLTVVERVVYTTPGAAGVLALRLPRLEECPYGWSVTIWHFGAANNTTVDDRNDGMVNIGQSVLTADLDRVTLTCLGDHWLLIEDVTT